MIIQFYIGWFVSSSSYVINLLKIQAETFFFPLKIRGCNLFVLFWCFVELYIHLIFCYFYIDHCHLPLSGDKILLQNQVPQIAGIMNVFSCVLKVSCIRSDLLRSVSNSMRVFCH